MKERIKEIRKELNSDKDMSLFRFEHLVAELSDLEAKLESTTVSGVVMTQEASLEYDYD